MTMINGYTLTTSWNFSPNGQFAFAKKGDEEFFIKKFDTPKYPNPKFNDPGTLKDRQQECREFENHQRNMLRELTKIAGPGGNLVVSVDFFREGSVYYKVTKKINIVRMSVEDVSKLPIQNKILLLRTIAFSLDTLHRVKIVHGDLKPDNLLITKSAEGKFISKIIDFDSSYFEEKTPNAIFVLGDPPYYSPELGTFHRESKEKPHADLIKITCKSDVFALGIIFHEYLCGKKPKVDDYKNIFEGVSAGKNVQLSADVNPELTALLKKMLHKDPRQRPSVREVFNELVLMKEDSSVSGGIKSTEAKDRDNREVDYVIRLANGQCRVHYKNGLVRTMPFHTIKSLGLEGYIRE